LVHFSLKPILIIIPTSTVLFYDLPFTIVIIIIVLDIVLVISPILLTYYLLDPTFLSIQVVMFAIIVIIVHIDLVSNVSPS